ncbi:hypothetical protein TKK_0000743 [Trichogramma kaykai]
MAPLTRVVFKERSKPWVTQEIRNLMRARDRAFRTYKRRRTVEAHNVFKRFRRDLKNKLDSAKSGYIQSRIAEATSLDEYWLILKGLGLSSRGNPSPLLHFSPEVLCTHYASVSSATPPILSEEIDEVCSEPLRASTAIFSLRPVTLEEVTRALRRCTSSGCGVDGLSSSVIRLASPALCTHLMKLINASFASGVFPSAWKLAKIVALSKSSSPVSPSDMHPISMLSELSKVLERLAHSHLAAHLMEQKFFDAQQHGFRPLHSTQTALLELTDSVRSAIVADWAARNNLRLNLTKTTAIFLGSLSYTSRIDLETIRRVSVNGFPIEYSTSTKSLGVAIHPCLRWDAQLDYAAAVYNALTVAQNLKLQRLQNACVRFVFGFIEWREHVTPYRLALGWLSVRRRREYLIAILAINIIRNRSPASLADRFVLASSRPNLRRSARRLTPPLCYSTPRTTPLNNSFITTASRILNSLPFGIELVNVTVNHSASLFNHFLALDKADWSNRCQAENLTPIPPALEGRLILTTERA